MRISRLLFLTFPLFIFANFASAQIPIEIYPSGHIGIKATINGIQGNFIFDTGGGITLLTKKFADKLKGLHKQDGQFTAFRATGERIDAELYTAQSIVLGTWTAKLPTVSIIDVELADFDGLISLNLFEKQPFTLNLKTKQFIIESAKSLSQRRGKNIELQIQKDRDKAIDIFTYVIVNDKDTLQFCLDSGAGSNSFSINSRYMNSLGIDKSDTTKVQHSIKTSEFNEKEKMEYYNTTVNKLQFKDASDIRKTNFKARFSNLIYDGIMSLNWIGNIITIDIEKARMIVN